VNEAGAPRRQAPVTSVNRLSLLALDGGNSKIDAALLTDAGEVVGAARWVGPDVDRPDLDSGPDYGDMRRVAHAVDAVCADAGVDRTRLPVAELGVYCLAGADFPADDRRIAAALKKHGWTTEDVVRNDTFAVLRAGSERDWGVGVVCGYGINCSGVAPDGRTVRFPAIGPVSGDWGGGIDIGGSALWYAVRAEDGRGERTALERLVPEYFGMKDPIQVTEAIHLGSLGGERVVELAPTVFRAAGEGDAIARSIIDRQADEVVAMAGSAIRRLRMTELDVEVVLGGGIFRTDDRGFFERIDAGLRSVARAARMVVLTVPPIVGAALLGLDQLGSDAQASGRVRDALTHQRFVSNTVTEATRV
jgi:N-acetylglucosamine kinase-like BadF-type ATPase